MRGGFLVLTFLAACGNGGSGPGSSCSDSACSPDVCARNGECDPLSQLRTLHVTWTVHEMPASAASCTSYPDLELDFTSDVGESFGFAPVPCQEGQFTIDRLPTRFIQVNLGEQNGPSAVGIVDASSDTVTFDLTF